MCFINIIGLVVVLLVLMLSIVQVGVIIGGICIIFDGIKKEVLISINNFDVMFYLIQLWIDVLEGNLGKVFFIIILLLY